jgi:hypothetical protein
MACHLRQAQVQGESSTEAALYMIRTRDDVARFTLGGYIAGRLSGKAARVPRAGSTLRRLRMGIAGRVPQLQCTKVTARIRVLPYNAGFGGSNPGQSSFAQQ